MSNSTRNKDLLRRFNGAVNARNWRELDQLVAASFVRHSCEVPPVNSRDELKAFLQAEFLASAETFPRTGIMLVSQPFVFTIATVMLAAFASVSAAGSVDLANAARLEACRPAAALEPLRRDPRLDAAARRIAEGQSLTAATTGAGYRARLSASIYVSATEGDGALLRLLAQRFCETLIDPELREIGSFRRGEDTWFVLARPLIPPEASGNALDERVLELVNRARGAPRRCGNDPFPATAPLRSDPDLRDAALAHARDMAAHGYLGHKGSDGSRPADRAARAGYAWKAVAENGAAGQPSAEEVVATWLASPGHCRNLMTARYSETGIAHAVNPDAEKGIYWAQLYATPE